jgi:hypothetical protein
LAFGVRWRNYTNRLKHVKYNTKPLAKQIFF